MSRQAAGKEAGKTHKEESGAEPLLAEPPSVEIAGETYQMRRLGWQDTFRLARIVATGAGAVMTDMRSLIDLKDEDLAAQIMFLFFAGLPYAEESAIDLLASVIQVDAKDARDPEKFPMGSELLIAEKLAEHQDMRAFFVMLGRLVTKGSLQSLSKDRSTKSSKGTRGRTRRSRRSPSPA
jgi:hypothetical protein